MNNDTPQYPPGNNQDVSAKTGFMMTQLQSETDFDNFTRQNDGAFLGQSVVDYFEKMLKKYVIDKNEAIAAADIERGYGYQILCGKRNAGRDKLIRMAIGIGMNVDEAQRLLTLAQKAVLYPKVKRDAGIIFCITHNYSVIETSLFLFDNGMDPLE